MFRITTTLLMLVSLVSKGIGQDNKISIEVNYGLQGNFFVRGYKERNTPGISYNFYNKNFLGGMGGIEVKYPIGNQSSVGLGYARSINSRIINFTPVNIPINVEDFTIRHTNNFYQLLFEQSLGSSSKHQFNLSTGLFYLRMSQQEIDASIFGLGLEERNFKNSRLEEGGTFLGIQYQAKIDNHFYLGIRSRVYYIISANYFEAVALNPTLTYIF
ncbi:MAG: hypothetical protein ACK5RQ_03945 [Bacteroidota bacterium]